MSDGRSVVGRFAPSPTGDFHLGNARTALLAWLHARAAGGRFIIRMEDLDAGRVREEYYASQLDDLRWLGIDWDEGPDVGGPHAPYLQSRRGDLYADALARLASRGALYRCVCTRREVTEAASAPHADHDEGPRYPGTCLERPVDELEERSLEGAAVRFRVPDRSVRVDDVLHGGIDFHPHRTVGDFVVRRKDGVAAYQLAVVVDDAAMGVTHVVRGADLLASTARQLLLYDALDLEPPRWLHVPLMLGPDGERLAKRHRSPTIRDLRERGLSAQSTTGWLLTTCGLMDAPRPVSAREFIPHFDPTRVARVPTRIEVFPEF